MITLHGMGSPNVVKIYIALEELALPYTVQPVDVFTGRQFDEAFLRLNPNAKVPVIVDPSGPGGRPYSPVEAATAAHAATLGATTHDIALDPATFWRNIPEKVWDCRIGGYQVLKKWLSYRDASIIDRPLTTDEVAHIQNTARRLAAILMMGLDLNASYRTCAATHRPLA